MTTFVTFENKESTLKVTVESSSSYITIQGASGNSTNILLEDVEDLIDYIRHAEGWTGG
jgi:hypothetical protein